MRDPIHAAANTVASRRRGVVGSAPLPTALAIDNPAATASSPLTHTAAMRAPERLLGLEDVAYT